MVAQAVSWMSHNRTMVAVMCGASIVVYGLYRFSVRTMKFFFHVSDKEIFTIGFVTGLVAAAGIAAAVLFVNRFITFQPDHLYRAALQELRKNSAVEEALGGFWRPTNFRGYAAESLEEAVRGSERRARSTYLEAPSRRMQMVFGVQARSTTASCRSRRTSAARKICLRHALARRPRLEAAHVPQGRQGPTALPGDCRGLGVAARRRG